MLFQYQARSTSQELITGQIDADNQSKVLQLLREKQLTPISITLIEQDKTSTDSSTFWSFNNRIDPLDAQLFSQQMYTLLKAGVPILRALGGIQESATNKRFADIVRQIREDLDSGRALSNCLTKYPEYFDDYYISMIRVGEVSGKLEEVFLKLHEQLNFSRLMRDQVKSAVRYPMIVIAVMILALGVINFFVIPAFAKVYEGFKSELPIFTKILINSSNFTLEYWPIILVLIGTLIFLVRQWLQTTTGRLSWDMWKLKIPVAGPIIHKAVMARFAKSLSLALDAGVPITNALSLVCETSDNTWMTQKLSGLRQQIERGDTLHRSAIASGVFTPIALQMILVGEEAGAIEGLLKEVSDLYQSQVEYDLKNLSSQIEPLLVFFLGGLVLVLALGVFLPIWDLGAAALKR